MQYLCTCFNSMHKNLKYCALLQLPAYTTAMNTTKILLMCLQGAAIRTVGKLIHLLLRLQGETVLDPNQQVIRKRNSAIMETIKDLPDIAHMNNVGR